LKEALLYERIDGKAVRCFLCRHGCRIKEGKRGICRVRENRDGTLYTLVYDKIVSTNIDPIEKKPLFHFLPGSSSFSIATMGCNFRCSFCQNYSISQVPRDHGKIAGQSYSPESIAEMAVRTGCQSISYTYTEPTVYYEIAKDVMKEAHKRNLYNVWVTNGYMSREMLEDARGLIDAANVDLKAFSDEFYRKYCHSHLQGVLDSLQLMKRMGIWLEVTTLLIPSLNDSAEEVNALAEFIHTALGPDTPWHVSRFYPRYKETSLPPTDVEKLRKVRQIGLEAGLLFVYTGNVPMDEGEKTFCPQCGNLVVDRRGYTTRVLAASQGKCRHCGYQLPGVGW